MINLRNEKTIGVRPLANRRQVTIKIGAQLAALPLPCLSDVCLTKKGFRRSVSTRKISSRKERRQELGWGTIYAVRCNEKEKEEIWRTEMGGSVKIILKDVRAKVLLQKLNNILFV